MGYAVLLIMQCSKKACSKKRSSKSREAFCDYTLEWEQWIQGHTKGKKAADATDDAALIEDSASRDHSAETKEDLAG
jgi:hypothetical protein